MHVQTSPATVLGYGTFSKADDSDKIAWKDGGLVEFVTALFDGEENPRRLTLDQSINGDRLAELSRCTLTCEVVPKTLDGLYRQNGRQATVTKDKWRVVAMELESAKRS